MHRILIFGIVILAILVRFVGISNHPAGFTPDEASFGYDAYSLLNTGKDQWGHVWPLSFQSFGDYKLPLYGYLAIPFVAIFGLNEFAVRLPNAIIGSLAVLATYLLCGKLFKDQRIKICAAFLIAVSPWHVSLSRGAFEANLTTFFLPLGVWAFFKAKESPRWLWITSLAFGLNLFAYHSARLLTPLIAFVLIYCEGASVIKKQKLAAVLFVLFLAIAGYTMFFGAGNRAGDIAIFNPTDKWATVADRRYEAVLAGVPDFIERVFTNKITYVFREFTVRYLSYFSPQFLFTEGAGEWTYGMIPGRGVFYLAELPFFLVAIWQILRAKINKTNPLLFILAWILLAPIPAALTKGSGYAGNRVAVMMPALQILSAYGVVVLWDMLKKVSIRNQKIVIGGYSSAFFLSVLFFGNDYVYHAARSQAPSMLYGRKEAVEYMHSIEDKYSKIIVSRSLSEPHIYTAFYKKWDVRDYQKSSEDWIRYKVEGHTFLDQLGNYSLGNYVFTSINYNDHLQEDKTLLVGKPEEFPSNISPLKTVTYPNGQKAILIVDPARMKQQ